MHKHKGFQFTIEDFSNINIKDVRSFNEKRKRLNNYFINEYLKDCILRLSPTTVKGYENVLRNFIEFLDDTPLSNATIKDVRNFLNEFKKKKRARGTIKRQLTALNSFYKYIEIYHKKKVPKLDEIDLHDYPMARWEGQGQNPLTRQDVRALLEAPDNLRNVLIITLIYYAGLRANEIATCKLKNIDTKNRVIEIIGKGNKPRRVPYPTKLDRALYYWINVERKSYVNASGPYLFPSKHREHLHPESIHRIVFNAAKKAKIQKIVGEKGDGKNMYKVHTHILRHSFARHCIEDEIPLVNLQKMMGHNDVNTTIYYAGENSVFQPYYQRFKGV